MTGDTTGNGPTATMATAARVIAMTDADGITFVDDPHGSIIVSAVDDDGKTYAIDFHEAMKALAAYPTASPEPGGTEREKLAHRDQHIAAFERAIRGALDGQHADTFANTLDPDSFALVERIATLATPPRAASPESVRGHNEIAAVLRQVLAELGRPLDDALIYDYAARYNGERTESAVRRHFRDFIGAPVAASPEPGAVDELVRKIAAEAYEHWDADRDTKVGKLLAALAGTTGIRLDLDAARAAAPRADATALTEEYLQEVEHLKAERVFERVCEKLKLDPNDGDVDSSDLADWIVSAIGHRDIRAQDARDADATAGGVTEAMVEAAWNVLYPPNVRRFVDGPASNKLREALTAALRAAQPETSGGEG